MLKAPGAELCQNTFGERKKIFCSHQCSPCPQIHYLRKWFCDFVKSEGGGGGNEIISSAGDTPDIEENHDNSNINNIARHKGERLEGKFVGSNVIDFSR